MYGKRDSFDKNIQTYGFLQSLTHHLKRVWTCIYRACIYFRSGTLQSLQMKNISLK